MQSTTSPRFVSVTLNRSGFAITRRINLAHVADVSTHSSYPNQATVTLATGERLELEGTAAHEMNALVARETVGIIETERLNYCDTWMSDRNAYLDAQASMFQACRDRGQDSTNRESMIGAISEFLGVNISSRRQLTPDEMNRVTAAVARVVWVPGWTLRRGEALRRVA